MRRIRLILAGGCVIGLLWIVRLLFAQIGAGYDLVPPGATDVRLDRQSLVLPRISYHLPPDMTLSGMKGYLVDRGWMHDMREDAMLRQDRTELSDVMAFIRHSWFGMVPEVALVELAPDDRRLVRIRLVRCFHIAPWTDCL